MGEEQREHLFISYATEDFLLADWLTRRLTAEGYRVWCDRIRLLGGESYPRDIDDAIKNKTFRLLSLLSRSSLHKPNPRKERTTALNIAGKRKIDFMIPLNVDGLSGEELDWMTSDLTYVPFHRSWADGLRQLLKKLSSIDTPRPLADGARIAAPTFLATDFLTSSEEELYTNCFSFSQIPDNIKKYRSKKKISKHNSDQWYRHWAFRGTGQQEVLAFTRPPPNLSGSPSFRQTESVSWSGRETAFRLRARDVVTELLRKSLFVKCLQSGLQYCEETDNVYFPYQQDKGNRLKYIDYSGGKNWFQTAGERKNIWRYHLAPSFWIRWDISEQPVAIMNIRIRISEKDNSPSSPKMSLRRRKSLCKWWYNHEWLNRVLGIAQFLAADKDEIVIGEHPGERIALFSKPLTRIATTGLDENKLREEREKYKSTDVPAEFEEEYDEEDDFE